MLRIALLLLVATVSTAQAQGRSVVGPMPDSCGKWTDTPKRTANHERLRMWVLGFLSGINVENQAGDFLLGRDVERAGRLDPTTIAAATRCTTSRRL
jgi:hypothetical protein